MASLGTKWPKLYFSSKCLQRTIPSEAGHTYTHIREYSCLSLGRGKCRSQINTFQSVLCVENLILFIAPFSHWIGSVLYLASTTSLRLRQLSESHWKQRISTNPLHPGTSHAQDIKPPAVLRLDSFPETKHYFFLRNSFLLIYNFHYLSLGKRCNISSRGEEINWFLMFYVSS